MNPSATNIIDDIIIVSRDFSVPSMTLHHDWHDDGYNDLRWRWRIVRLKRRNSRCVSLIGSWWHEVRSDKGCLFSEHEQGNKRSEARFAVLKKTTLPRNSIRSTHLIRLTHGFVCLRKYSNTIQLVSSWVLEGLRLRRLCCCVLLPCCWNASNSGFWKKRLSELAPPGLFRRKGLFGIITCGSSRDRFESRMSS